MAVLVLAFQSVFEERRGVLEGPYSYLVEDPGVFSEAGVLRIGPLGRSCPIDSLRGVD